MLSGLCPHGAEASVAERRSSISKEDGQAGQCHWVRWNLREPQHPQLIPTLQQDLGCCPGSRIRQGMQSDELGTLDLCNKSRSYDAVGRHPAPLGMYSIFRSDLKW